ncbi:MAG TPA: hypothetical protein VGC09_13660 [Rhodopila sp.]
MTRKDASGAKTSHFYSCHAKALSRSDCGAPLTIRDPLGFNLIRNKFKRVHPYDRDPVGSATVLAVSLGFTIVPPCRARAPQLFRRCPAPSALACPPGRLALAAYTVGS